MGMQKARSFFFIFFMGILVLLGAQEEEDDDTDPPPETRISADWSPFIYSKGDQTLAFSLGITIPTIFVGDKGTLDDHNLNIGGTIALSYSYFLTPDFFVGGELGGMAASSKKRGNWLYIVPFGLRVGYQFSTRNLNLPTFLRRIEIPVFLTIGGEGQSYLDNEENYFGFFIKPGVSFFFRFNQNWSFGLNTAWWWIPQWTQESSKDVYGNFMELTLTARYHF